MKTITLKVTTKVLEQVTKSVNQEQIEITPTSDVVKNLSGASISNHIQIKIADFQALWVGDAYAIWRAHNKDNSNDFDALFTLLSKSPDTEFEFLCEVV